MSKYQFWNLEIVFWNLIKRGGWGRQYYLKYSFKRIFQ